MIQRSAWLALVVILTGNGFALVASQQNPPYSAAEAERYCLYAFANYCGESSLKNWTCYFCTPASVPVTVEFIFSGTTTDTFGYAGHTDKEVIFSFRGTELNSFDNWFTDLSIAKTTPWPNEPGAEVHEGFFHAYMGIYDQVHAAADYYAANYPSLPFVFTGHSLGAALSEMCAADLATNGSYTGPLIVWNVGAPRVGNAQFAALYTKVINATWRTINSNDMIPHLPEEFLGYHHAPYEVWYPKNMTGPDASYVICNSSGEDPACSNSVVPRLAVPPHFNYFGYYALTPCGGPGPQSAAV